MGGSEPPNMSEVSVQLTRNERPPPAVVIAPSSEGWRKQKLLWAKGLPRAMKAILVVLTLWACLGVGIGAVVLSSEPHGLVVPCGVAFILGSLGAWSMFAVATWVEDEPGQEATAPLFLLLTVVAVMLCVAIGHGRAWLVVLTSLQCLCLVFVLTLRPVQKLRRDFGWRGLKRVGASGSSDYVDWLLVLRSCLQASTGPRRLASAAAAFG